MATFYCTTNTFTPFTPTVRAAWDNTASYVTGYLGNSGNAYLTNTALATTTKSGVGAGQFLYGIFISPPMDSASTAFTMDNGFNCTWYCRASESNADANAFLAWSIGVISEDGSTLRWSTSIMKGGTELATTLISRNNAGGYTNSPASYTIQEGDRLYVEWGIDKDAATARDIALNLGYSNANADLSTTQGDSGADNPWMNLEYAFTFKAESTPSTGVPNQLMMTGCGT